MFKAAKINIADLAKYLGLERQFLYQIDKGERKLPKKYRPLVIQYLKETALLMNEVYDKYNKD